MKKPLRVIVVDDNDDFRNTLVGLLAELNGVSVVGQGDSGEQAVRLVREHRPDVLISDLVMPVTGWAAIDAVRRARPLIRIIVVTALSEQDRHRALRAGADAVVPKATADLLAEIADALALVTGRSELRVI